MQGTWKFDKDPACEIEIKNNIWIQSYSGFAFGLDSATISFTNKLRQFSQVRSDFLILKSEKQIESYFEVIEITDSTMTLMRYPKMDVFFYTRLN